MSIKTLNFIVAYLKSNPLLLLMSIVLTLTACEGEDKPDYVVKRLRVDAGNLTVSGSDPTSEVGWHIEFMIANNGGDEGLGPDAYGVPHAPIPVLFIASIPNHKLNGCPSVDTDDVLVYDGPSHRILYAWREVPVNSGPIFSFRNVFVTEYNPPKNCIIDKVIVQFDAKKPDFESTVEESDETNNSLIVDITNFPYGTNVWVKENF